MNEYIKEGMSCAHFRFKHFSVNQKGVAMRINTDGVLLGAWVALPCETHSPKVLDIGTGSGVIALMAAQRLAASHRFPSFRVDALEPHLSSACVSEGNFQASPWASQMHLSICSLQDFKSQHFTEQALYDLILSNPPYFANSLRPPLPSRCFVRHTDSLSHADLLEGVAALLHPSGCFGVVLPALQQKGFIAAAASVGLFLRRETLVYTVANRPPKRALMEFSKKEEPLQSDSLIIHNPDNQMFSSEYIELTKEFYLAF